MMATKQAMVAGDHVSGLDATIFYMDIRAHGKDFDQYYERARKREHHYIKSMPSRIVQVPGSKDLRVRSSAKPASWQEKEFDLLLWSVGMEPPPAWQGLRRRLEIELNEFGFCDTDRLLPLSTSRPGVFVAGAFQEPKDIPETVTQASAAASMAMELLAPARNTLITKKAYPDEHDVTDEEPRIGVFRLPLRHEHRLGGGCRTCSGDPSAAGSGSCDAYYVHLLGHQPRQHRRRFGSIV